MSKQRLQVNADVSTIKRQLRKDAKYLQGIRLYAVYQIAQGKKAEELEGLYQTSHKSICNWVHRYNAEGLPGLIDHPRKGRPSRLNAAQREMIKQAVLNIPEPYGYHSATWTGAMVLSYIENTFGVSYKKAQIYNLLHNLGLGFQRERTSCPEVGERENRGKGYKKPK
jgi:transposase